MPEHVARNVFLVMKLHFTTESIFSVTVNVEMFALYIFTQFSCLQNISEKYVKIAMILTHRA